MSAPRDVKGRAECVPQAGAIINLHYPLRPETHSTEVVIDFETQTLYFRRKGSRKWQSVALWMIQEQCD